MCCFTPISFFALAVLSARATTHRSLPLSPNQNPTGLAGLIIAPDEIRLIRWEKASTLMGMGTGFQRLDAPGKVVLHTMHAHSAHAFRRDP
jgi:hypothetical protein